MTIPTTLSFDAAIDRPLINVEGESVRYLVVSIKAPPDDSPATASRPPLNLGLVIDASGSMQGRRLEAAKRASIGVAESLSERDRLSVVSFASESIVHVDAVPTDGPGVRGAAEAIRQLVTRGSTNLCDGWLRGCECVAGQVARAGLSGRNQVVLLSDGHANEGECSPAVLERHAHELRARGIMTSTVGIGAGYSPVQLQAIAEAGGGRMHDAERPEEIVEILSAELAETLRTSVENLEIDVECPPGVAAETLGTAPSVRRGDRFTAVLGSIIAGASRRLVIRVTSPEGTLGQRLSLRVGARWRTPGREGESLAGPIDVALVFASPAECAGQPRDLERCQIVAEQWHSHIIRRAMGFNQDGDLDTAHRYAERELGYFKRYCEGLPGATPLVDLLGRFAPSTKARYAAVNAKEVLLSSYKTSRSERDYRSAQRGGFDLFIPNAP